MIAFFLDNSLILLLGIGTVFNFFWLRKHADDLRLTVLAAAVLAVLHTAAGVAAVKVFAVLEKMDFGVMGSMSVFGVIFFLPLLYYTGAKIFRRNVAKVYDIFTPCMLMSIMFARINCILSGCCLGKYIPGLAPARWPTREIEVVFYIVLLLLIIFGGIKKKTAGLLYPLYMISYGVLRFILECFREADTTSFFHLAHLWAVICFGIGLSFYLEIRNASNGKRWQKNGT